MGFFFILNLIRISHKNEHYVVVIEVGLIIMNKYYLSYETRKNDIVDEVIKEKETFSKSPSLQSCGQYENATHISNICIRLNKRREKTTLVTIKN